MKKSFLIIGLFSLMMVLTSFNSPVETGGRGNELGLGYTTETGGRGNELGLGYTTETGGRGNELGAI